MFADFLLVVRIARYATVACSVVLSGAALVIARRRSPRQLALQLYFVSS